MMLFRTLILLILLAPSVEGARRYRRLPTHPIFLWAKTVTQSPSLKQRKLAAFKLSQYSQPIYQDSVIEALLKCVKDSNLEIKVHCTKALRRARKRSKKNKVRAALIWQFRNKPKLKKITIGSLIGIKADDDDVYEMLFKEAKKATSPEELVILMNYFEHFGLKKEKHVKGLIEIYEKFKGVKVRTAIVKALSAGASGQSKVVNLLANCATSNNTPLQLHCLAALQTQGIRNKRTWKALETAIMSNDLDVLEATLDALDALAPSKNETITKRLLAVIEEVKDPEIREKAVIGLGVCGDYGKNTVKALNGLVEDKSVNEDIRIAAALVLGKQAKRYPSTTRKILARCQRSETSGSLKTACNLGIRDLRVVKAEKKSKKRQSKKSRAK